MLSDPFCLSGTLNFVKQGAYLVWRVIIGPRTEKDGGVIRPVL
jgi:hypothetical protein